WNWRGRASGPIASCAPPAKTRCTRWSMPSRRWPAWRSRESRGKRKKPQRVAAGGGAPPGPCCRSVAPVVGADAVVVEVLVRLRVVLLIEPAAGERVGVVVARPDIRRVVGRGEGVAVAGRVVAEGGRVIPVAGREVRPVGVAPVLRAGRGRGEQPQAEHAR